MINMINLDNIKFDKDGLIPVVIQDYYTNEVLTLAYMNKESIEITIKEGKTCFYSRSRKELWRKGETSGNYQYVVDIKLDCDSDSLLIKVSKDGPACHTLKESCFFNELYSNKELNNKLELIDLYNLIYNKKEVKEEKSYTSYLFDKGLDKILKKVGEESTEVIIAAKNNDNQELIYEISDLVYHVIVLMIEQGISLSDIKKELSNRNVISVKKKQEYMG